MSYLIRVLLPDTPGSLGQLADAIGMADGNIQSVDIVEAFPDGTVMDDIVVDLPSGAMADSLITAASTVDGVEVDSIRPFSGRVDRRGQIELLASVARTTANISAVAEAMETVVAAIPQALTSTWAIVLDVDGDIYRVAASAAAPADDGSSPTDIDVTAARTLRPEHESWVPESWSLLDSALAAAPLGSSGMVLIIGRTGGPEFLPSEVQHLGNVAAILGAFVR